MNEIIEKPWGMEEVIEINDLYMMKKLTMYAGHRCSIQYHNLKKETIYVLSGKLRIYYGESVDELRNSIFCSGDSITIPPKQVHRMEAVGSSCTYLESSSVHLKDVIRLEDDYSRKK